MRNIRKEKTEKFAVKGLAYCILTLLALALIISISSCKKESTCNCGIVQDDAIEYDATGNTYYTLTVKSDCSGNNKKVYVDYSSWLNTPVGANTCINGVGDWMPQNPVTEVEYVVNKQL
ncbi:hypothetical protein N8Z10_00805 [bacterium]|nr:hypothetical protein [bacterium]